MATSATGVPLAFGADERRFKLILLDTGLVSAQFGLDIAGLLPNVDLMLAHRGAVAEQVVGQAVTTGALRGLHLFMAERGLHLGVRFNSDLPTLVE